MSSPDRARRFILGILGAVVFVVAKVTVQHLVSEAKADDIEERLPLPARAMFDELRAKGHFAEYERWASRIPMTAVGDSVARAVFRGIPYLSPENLKRHAIHQTRLFSAMPTQDCARLGRAATVSADDTAVVYAALRTLGPLAQTEQGVLSARALIASKLEGRMWPGPNTEDATTGLLYALDSLPTVDGQRLAYALTDSTASDADACWATVEMYRLAAQLPDSLAVPYLRGLALLIYNGMIGID